MPTRKIEILVKVWKILFVVTMILCLLCIFALLYCYYQASIADPVVEVGRKNALLESGWFFVKLVLSIFTVSCGSACAFLISKNKLRRSKKNIDDKHSENK